MANRLGSNPSLTAYHRTPFFGSRHTLQSGTLTNKPARLVYKTQATAAVPLETSTPTSATASLESVPLEDFQEPSATPFNWKDHWYPVVFERDVGPSQLYNFTLLGVPIVIWRDGNSFRAFKDACPHRLVPLSEGRIAPNGCLECPYHGWQFNGEGACTSIPQGGDISNPRAQATAYQCVAKQGLVWVRLQPSVDDVDLDTSKIPILPELDDPDWFELTPMWRDIPMEYATLIENVVDAGKICLII